jgi:hypothetical protein
VDAGGGKTQDRGDVGNDKAGDSGNSGHQRTTYRMLALSNEVGLGLCNSGIGRFPRIVCRAIEELNMFVPN